MVDGHNYDETINHNYDRGIRHNYDHNYGERNAERPTNMYKLTLKFLPINHKI